VTRRGWLLFVAISIIWGMPYLLIRVAVRDVEPGTLVFLRTSIGGLVLLPFVARLGGFGPALRRWRPVVLFTIIEIAVPWLMLASAEQHLSSSVTAVLVSMVPIVGVVLARVLGSAERATRLQWLGLVLGVAGVTLLVGLDVGSFSLLAVLEVGVVVVCYAVGPVIQARHLADTPALPIVAACLLLAATGYLPYAALHVPHSLSGTQVASLVALGVVCTAAAFVIFFALIADIGPARATVIAQVNPAVAVLLGVVFLGEAFTRGMAVGFPMILVGSVLAARRAGGSARAADQSIRTVPVAVANTAPTSPVSSDGSSQSTSTSSSG